MATREELNRSFETLEALVAERMAEVNRLRGERDRLRNGIG